MFADPEHGCCRRWAWEYIAGRKGPRSDSLEFGDRAHQIAAQFLIDGSPPPIETKEGRCVLEGIPYLPRPGTVQVEQRFRFELDGVTFTGAIDVADPAERRKLDHKFVSGPKFALTPETLPHNPQALLYVLAPPTWEVTKLRWVYYSKKSRKAWPVDAEVSILDVLSEVRKRIVPGAQQMIALHAMFQNVPTDHLTGWINDLIPNRPGTCNAFGKPCPHAGYCRLIGAPDMTDQQTPDLAQINALLAQRQAELAQAGQVPGTPAAPGYPPPQAAPAPPAAPQAAPAPPAAPQASDCPPGFDPAIWPTLDPAVREQLRSTMQTIQQTAPINPPEHQQAQAAAPTVLASTAVMGMAAEAGIELSTIQGTGKNGRVTQGDVKKAIKAKQTAAPAPAAPPAPAPRQVPPPQQIPGMAPNAPAASMPMQMAPPTALPTAAPPAQAPAPQLPPGQQAPPPSPQLAQADRLTKAIEHLSFANEQLLNYLRNK
jgi:hypothetical protein